MGPGDMHAQAEQVFENVRLALAASGETFKDVVKLNFYLTDMSRADDVRGFVRSTSMPMRLQPADWSRSAS